MKQELIPVTTARIQNDYVKAVNARLLHRFLEVNAKYADWIKRRIDECGYRENLDYIVSEVKRQPDFFSNLRKNKKSSDLGGLGRPRKEYIISLDMAKELAMLERNSKGRLARRYFIECERRALASEKVERAVFVLTGTNLPADTAIQVLYFRAYGLSQKETARALNISSNSIRTLEEKLRAVGISLPPVRTNKRLNTFRKSVGKLIRAILAAQEEGRREVLPCCL